VHQYFFQTTRQTVIVEQDHYRIEVSKKISIFTVVTGTVVAKMLSKRNAKGCSVMNLYTGSQLE